MSEVIRVCIGTEPRARVPEKVLIHSIKKNTSSNVEFFPMDGPRWEDVPGGHTGFSFRRWLIPKFFGYSGKAIYLDCDQIVFADIRELWEKDVTEPADNPAVAVWCAKKRAPLWSVMLIDCAKAREFWGWHPDRLFQAMKDGRLSKQDVMHRSWIEPKPKEISLVWNHIDYYYEGQTRLLHYSNLRTQPWFNPGHDLRSLWERVLVDSIKSGELTREEFDRGRAYFNKRIGLHPYYEKYIELFNGH